MSRKSLLQSIKINTIGCKAETVCKCVGCQVTINNSGLAHYGSVLNLDPRFLEKTYTSGGELLGTLTTYLTHTPITQEIRNPEVITTRKIAFLTRRKGMLCDKCSSNIETYRDRSGKVHMLVETKGIGTEGKHHIPLTESQWSMRTLK